MIRRNQSVHAGEALQEDPQVLLGNLLSPRDSATGAQLSTGRRAYVDEVWHYVETIRAYVDSDRFLAHLLWTRGAVCGQVLRMFWDKFADSRPGPCVAESVFGGGKLNQWGYSVGGVQRGRSPKGRCNDHLD